MSFETFWDFSFQMEIWVGALRDSRSGIHICFGALRDSRPGIQIWLDVLRDSRPGIQIWVILLESMPGVPRHAEEAVGPHTSQAYAALKCDHFLQELHQSVGEPLPEDEETGSADDPWFQDSPTNFFCNP